MTNSDLFLFVSHVSEDQEAALEIVNELERRNVPCWISPRDVRPGKPFDDEIAAAIDASRAMLLIFSEHCNESDYIRREITVAGESHKIIIPFRIGNAEPRRALRVRLSDLHWIDGFVSRERALDQVVRAVDPDRLRQQEEKGRQRDEGEPSRRSEEPRQYQEEGRNRQALPQSQEKSDQQQRGQKPLQRRRLFLHRPAATISVIVAVPVAVFVPILIWMLVFRQTSNPSSATRDQSARAAFYGRWVGFWDNNRQYTTSLTIDSVSRAGEVTGSYVFMSGSPTKFAAKIAADTINFGILTFKLRSDGKMEGKRSISGILNTTVLARDQSRAGPFDGRWEGIEAGWHISGTITNGEFLGNVDSCVRSNGTTAANIATIHGQVYTDGDFVAETLPAINAREVRDISGQLPNIQIKAHHPNEVGCPDAKIRLVRASN